MRGAQRLRAWGKGFILADHFLVVAGFYLVFPIIGLHFVDHLGWAAATVGLALGLRQVCQQGLGLLGGALSDRFGAKRMIVAGLLLRAAGFAWLALAQAPWILFLSCALSGLGGCLFEPARGAVVIKLTRVHERNRFFALMMSLESAASVLGALLGTVLLRVDFRWVALGGCAVFVIAALLNACLLPAYRVALPGASILSAMRRPLRDRPFMLLVLTLSGYFMLNVQLVMLLPVRLSQVAGTPQALAWMYGMDGALAVLLLYPLARFGERRYSESTRVQAGLALMTGALACLPWAAGVAGLFAVLAVFYIGVLIVEPAREALVTRYAVPQARASYLGMGRIGLALGGLLGYISGGALMDAERSLGLPGLPWMVLSGVGALTLCALARLGPRNPSFATSTSNA